MNKKKLEEKKRDGYIERTLVLKLDFLFSEIWLSLWHDKKGVEFSLILFPFWLRIFLNAFCRESKKYTYKLKYIALKVFYLLTTLCF